jgi:hypothetical protein
LSLINLIYSGFFSALKLYTIMILDLLLIYTSKKHYLLLLLKISACASLFRHLV